MKHVVMWSGGISSWKTARIVIDRHGPDDVVLLFADTRAEEADLHRFNRQATALLGIGLTRVTDPQERDPWDVFFDVRWLGNSRLAPCSKILKQDPARAWLDAHCDPADTTVYIGIDWDETHRIPGIAAAHAHTQSGCADKARCAGLFTPDGRAVGAGCRRLLPDPWRVEFPLAEPPYRTKADLIEEARALGLEEPLMYREGYAHANCAGLCVRAGQAQWALTLRLHPDRYAHAEAQENRFRAEINPQATILRDWKQGGRPLPLTEFRERQEAHAEANPSLFDDLDWGGCGCFTDTEEVAA